VRRKPTAKPKDAFSVKAYVKGEVSVKSKLPRTKRSRKEKEKTYRISELSKARAYPLGEALLL